MNFMQFDNFASFREQTKISMKSFKRNLLRLGGGGKKGRLRFSIIEKKTLKEREREKSNESI